MLRAYQQVMSNQGSAGADGMSVKELSNHLHKNRDKIVADVCNRKYLPQTILGVAIPKSNGKIRLLGIPTVTDRWLQQAVHQAIMPLFEVEFKKHSYGFRPNRNAQQAVQQAQTNIHEGYQHIVDIDLKNFFDEVDHCILLQLLYRKVKCPSTLRLIRKWLRAPILINGKLTKRRKGVPQGSPLTSRTHPQTLSLSNGLLLGGVDFSFGYFIKSIIFMINEKIAEFRVGRKDQSGTDPIEATKAAYKHCRAVDGNLWGVTNTSLSLCSASQREQISDCHSGKFSGFYSKTTAQSDRSCKTICSFTGYFDQQNSQGGIGRVFSKKTARWPKRRRSLKYRSPMTACGSKSLRRFTIFSSLAIRRPYPHQILFTKP